MQKTIFICLLCLLGFSSAFLQRIKLTNGEPSTWVEKPNPHWEQREDREIRMVEDSCADALKNYDDHHN